MSDEVGSLSIPEEAFDVTVSNFTIYISEGTIICPVRMHI